MMDRRIVHLALPLAGFAIAGTLFYMGWRERSTPPPMSTAERAALARKVGATPMTGAAPDVTLFDRSETPTPLSAYRGRVVFVNFWATWCGPCVAEMPSMIALREATDPDEIAFISIAEDDFWPPVDAYLAKNPLPFDVYRDRPPRVEIPFSTGSYPTSFLIDTEGQFLYRFGGARDWTHPEMKRLFESAGVTIR